MCDAATLPRTEREYSEAGRAFRMAYILIIKGPRTARELAEDLGCTVQNVYYLRDSVSNAAPIVECDGGRLALLMDANDWI
jgi:hypothetical protein